MLRNLIPNRPRAATPTSASYVGRLGADDEDSESGEASSAHTGDGEEPWYEAGLGGRVRVA